MSDDLDGWGGAEFILAADRLDTPDVIEAADPSDMLRQVASAAMASVSGVAPEQDTASTVSAAPTQPGSRSAGEIST